MPMKPWEAEDNGVLLETGYMKEHSFHVTLDN